MKRIFIIGACRTPIGKMGGALGTISSVELGSIVIKEVLQRSEIPLDRTDHVCMGCVIQAGLGQNVARQASLKAGLSVETKAETMNIVCGSGLEAVNSAARRIQCGDADIVVAGGMESMSNAPFALMKARFGYRMGNPMMDSSLIDTMVNDALWDASYNCHMGITAENIAEKYRFSREELDIFALESQKKAIKTQESGGFKDEIVPVVVCEKKGKRIVDTDENPRAEITIEKLSSLSPAFKPNGMVTAGNSSGINDGAAAVVLASEDKVREMKLSPLAEWVDGTLAGGDPSIMGVVPVKSSQKLLNKLRMSIDDLDLVESNEAFASQSLAVQKELGIPNEKLNIRGGSIALGHPVGASGCRILVTLLYNMIHQNVHIGLATLCIGGGMGCSTIIRR